MKPTRDEWDAYLEAFHSKRPGITEDVLMHCLDDGGATPYDWLLDGVDRDARILDLGCGSAPTRPRLGDGWIGIDRSHEELQRAASHGRTPLIRADLGRLPVRPKSIDTVICSMALMLVEPLADALVEIRNALSPTGEVRILVPSRRPLTIRERAAHIALATSQRSAMKFPASPMWRASHDHFHNAALTITSDERRRFIYRLDTRTAQRQFIDSWYRPSRAPVNLTQHHSTTRLRPRTIAVPLRLITARPA